MSGSQETTNWWRWVAYALVTGLIGVIFGIRFSYPGFNFNTKTPAFFTDDNFRLMFRAGFCLCGVGVGPLMSQAYDFFQNRCDSVYGVSGYTRRSRMISYAILVVGMILVVAAVVAQKSVQHS